jgi:hypothetical protein
MSKKYFVVYTFKENLLPKIYRTKATAYKYLTQNNFLEMEIFSN